MTSNDLSKLLRLADKAPPLSVEQIAAACDLSAGRVYAILREHRPDRARKPRRQTSVVPAKVRALHKRGTGAARIAALLGVKRQYVYRILAAGETTS